jgi:N-methylhydantoinase B
MPTVKLDPITLAVLAGRLEQLVDEMDATLFRSAFNPTIAEAHDACHGLYDARTGDTLVQGGSGLPIFVGSMSFAVRYVIDIVKRDGPLQDGDVYAFNDPYDGGTHLNDIKLVRPVMRNGELFCFLASVGHWNDVGGNVPGSYNPAATELPQEGVLVPPMKLFDRGRRREDVVDLLRAISRVPVNAYGDLNAQVAALEVGTRRLNQLLDDYGDAVVSAAFDELSDAAERLMRAQIAGLADGVYHRADALDNDGGSPDRIPVAVDVTVAGDELTLDFSPTAMACRGPLNIARSTAVAACYVALKHLFPEVPANAGCMRPVTVIIPDGSLLDARLPRPVGGYTETILRMMDVLFGAIAVAAPERAMGASYGTINALSISGAGAGGRWVFFAFFGGGLGGHPEADGLDHANAPLSTAIIPPLEVFEAAYPIRFTQWALRTDSGGAGEHRGGLGAVYEIELLADAAEMSTFGERAFAPPPGSSGGGPAAVNVISYETEAGWVRPPLGAKIVGVNLHAGQRLRIESPGGGGWGDPARRDPGRIARDVRLGYLSPAAALAQYGIDRAAGDVSR